jgi:hypothetical protein
MQTGTRVFKATNDDWPSAYEMMDMRLVQVSFLLLQTGQYRVSVCGSDDPGMERDFPADQRAEAQSVYEDILSDQLVKRQKLFELGFAMPQEAK